MRFSKPTTEPPAPATGFSPFANFALTIFAFHIFALNALIQIGCYSPPGILERAYTPERHAAFHNGFEIQIEFLSADRLLDRARWLNSGAFHGRRAAIDSEPPYPAARRAPDLTAIEIRLFNYGDRSATVDFARFRLQRLATNSDLTDNPAEDRADDLTDDPVRPLGAADFAREYAGLAIGSLAAYNFAFAQRETHRFSVPIPDWHGQGLRAESDTRSVAEMRSAARRTEDAERSIYSERQSLPPGGEIRGIVLFAMLAENQRYELDYEFEDEGDQPPDTKTNSDGATREFHMRPLAFEYRLRIMRDQSRPLFTDAGDDREDYLNAEARSAREYFRMHEQLQEHDRLRQRMIAEESTGPGGAESD
ncbi:MAG: hypothetical protein NXI24_21620 [bacterium]|nr:hypothetical protein [bacterium]